LIKRCLLIYLYERLAIAVMGVVVGDLTILG